MIDIDHFKAVNDTYGHAAGDLVLAMIAEECRARSGTSTFLARIGGEEFIDPDDRAPTRAEDRAGAAARAVAAQTVSTIKGDVSVTASFGMATSIRAAVDLEVAHPSRRRGALRSQARRAQLHPGADGKRRVRDARGISPLASGRARERSRADRRGPLTRSTRGVPYRDGLDRDAALRRFRRGAEATLRGGGRCVWRAPCFRRDSGSEFGNADTSRSTTRRSTVIGSPSPSARIG